VGWLGVPRLLATGFRSGILRVLCIWKGSVRWVKIYFSSLGREREEINIRKGVYANLDSELPLQNYLTLFESLLDLTRNFQGISYITSIRGLYRNILTLGTNMQLGDLNLAHKPCKICRSFNFTIRTCATLPFLSRDATLKPEGDLSFKNFPRNARNG
jgi:hypothetical protein